MENEGLLERFNKEVLISGPEGILPNNLSNEWLSVLLAQSESLNESDESASVTELVAAVIHFYGVKKGLRSVSLSESELIDCIDEYSVELAVEQRRRKTNSKDPQQQ